MNRKILMNGITDTESAYNTLAQAIVLQAAEDCLSWFKVRYLLNSHRLVITEENSAKVLNIIKNGQDAYIWLKSDISLYTSVDNDVIINAVKKQFSDWLIENNY